LLGPEAERALDAAASGDQTADPRSELANRRPEGPGRSFPLLSIVIPTYNIGEYISSCLDAIAQQTFREIEIIVVDGGSTDSTCEVLEERRSRDPRLTVIYQGRIGPGNARNAGARLASGEYLWFVDGDDMISPECLLTISERLEAERPDVLVVNHEVVHSSGRIAAGFDNKLIMAAGTATSTLAERPWLIDLSLVSWNKIVRRTFLTSADAKFLPVWPHEDVPVSCALLLAAERLSVLPHVCYYYRRERSGSAMKTGDTQRHFAIFSAWGHVLDRVRQQAGSGAAAVTADVYRLLFQRAIWHYSLILDTDGYGIGALRKGGFVVRADRRTYFQMMSQQYAKYVPPGYERPGGFRGIKFRLIERNAYLAYSVLNPITRWRRALVAGRLRLSRRR
jgi:CDP-glycerol glycerophosphotransferase